MIFFDREIAGYGIRRCAESLISLYIARQLLVMRARTAGNLITYIFALLLGHNDTNLYFTNSNYVVYLLAVDT